MPHNRLRDPRQALGFSSSALDDLIHGWPADYWTQRYALADGLAPRAADPSALSFPDLSTLARDGEPRRIRVCIATEDFVGPVNNGGIGTTYTHLAHLLAAEGHEVTVAYLRGDHAEKETVAHWIAHYARRNIRFVPVPDRLGARLHNAERWSRPSLLLLDYLEREAFDLVHVSEWRGSGMYPLIAKRLGLALRETVIAVKTSSPWAWNRDYGLEAVGNTPDLFKMAMERRSVELADLVIGGSAHLLRWMASQGYRLPAGRTFVQPNVVVMGEYRGDAADRAPHVQDGRITELVFFGRLEARKGLEVFCEAVSLLDAEGLVDKVSFCGKPGSRLPSHPTLDTPDYIREVTRDWRAKIEIHTELDNAAVIDFLCRRPCIAVMPSLIENSSLAVYETTQYGIPFLASDVGGNAELIAPEDRDRVLFQPRPCPLYDKLLDVARNGLPRARPAFDNAANLAVWRQFHAHPQGWQGLNHVPVASPVSISLLVRVRYDGSSVGPLLTSIGAQEGAVFELLLITDPALPLPFEVESWLAAHPTLSLARISVGQYESDAVAMAEARAAARHPYLFLPYEGSRLLPDALATLAHAVAAVGLDLATGFFGEAEDGAAPTLIVTPLGDDASYAPFDRTVLKGDVLIRATAFDALGGLTDEYKVGGAYGELVLTAQLHGLRCEVVPRVLSHRRSIADAEALAYGDPARELWRALRPLTDSVPQALKPMLMALAGIAPRYADLHARTADFNRDREQLIAHRDFWKARADAAGVPPPAAPPVPEPARTGGVFDVKEGVILGWAAGPDGGPVDVAIHYAGQVIATVRADQRLSAFLPVPPEARDSGFSFDLGLLYAEAEEAFAVDLFVGDVALAHDLPIYPPGASLEALRHDGSCENNKAGLIRGWAWRRDRPDEPVTLAFYLDDTLWRIERADIFRQDLLAARKGTGDHGFAVPVPVARGPAPLRIDIRLAGTGLPLRRSPLRVEGRTVTVMG